MRRFIKKIKNSIWGKILKTIFKILWWGLEVLIIFLAIVIIVPRLTNNEKTFLGFRIFNVATGSMEPEYAVGDILISKERDPSLINVGDNIVYLGDEGGYDGKIITHNVVKIDRDEKGDYLFHTKGRANTVEDPIVHEDQIYGVIVYNNIVLAWLSKILTNRYGLYFFVMVPVILYGFIGLIKTQGERIEQEKEERRLEEEKRKRRKMKKAQMEKKRRELENEVEIEEETQGEIEEPIKELAKTKKNVPKKKKEQEENLAEEQEEAESSEKTPKKTRNTTKKDSTKSTEKNLKTENKETAPKTTKRKKAQEE